MLGRRTLWFDWNSAPSLPAILATPCIGLAVAVGAEESQVLESVVVADAVEVMKLQGKAASSPSRQTALLTSIRLEPLG